MSNARSMQGEKEALTVFTLHWTKGPVVLDTASFSPRAGSTYLLLPGLWLGLDLIFDIEDEAI
jgi:hypothetical protein